MQLRKSKTRERNTGDTSCEGLLGRRHFVRCHWFSFPQVWVRLCLASHTGSSDIHFDASKNSKSSEKWLWRPVVAASFWIKAGLRQIGE